MIPVFIEWEIKTASKQRRNPSCTKEGEIWQNLEVSKTVPTFF